jgi:hypothetical protein
MATKKGDNTKAKEFSCTRLTPPRDRNGASYYVIPRPIATTGIYRSNIVLWNIDWSKVAPYKGKKQK